MATYRCCRQLYSILYIKQKSPACILSYVKCSLLKKKLKENIFVSAQTSPIISASVAVGTGPAGNKAVKVAVQQSMSVWAVELMLEGEVVR